MGGGARLWASSAVSRVISGQAPPASVFSLTCMKVLVRRNELLHSNTVDLKIIMLSVRAKHKKESRLCGSVYIKL